MLVKRANKNKYQWVKFFYYSDFLKQILIVDKKDHNNIKYSLNFMADLFCLKYHIVIWEMMILLLTTINSNISSVFLILIF